MPSYSKRGLELSVNTAGAWTQNSSRVATFADGGFVVVWDTSDPAADGSGGAIKAQRFDSAGNKAGGEFLVNSSFASGQSLPAVTSFADGSFAIAWTTDDPLQDGNGRAIMVRLFGASGLPTGPEFLVNSATAGNQVAPSITTLANGTFVVSWWEAYFGEVHARIFTADGTALGADFRVNTNMEGLQNSTAVSALAGGGFVVTWRTANTAEDGSGDSVKGQVFSSTGARVGGEFLVNTNKFGHQNDPAVAALAGGGFVVTWVTSQGEDGDGSAVKMQLFSATGAKVGGELRVNSAGAGSQDQPAVTALPDGGFMVAWTTTDTSQDGDRYAVKAQVFDSAGTRVGTEFLVNTQANDNQWYADIATLSDGRVIVTWTDSSAEGNANWGIKAQILGAGDPPPPPPPPNWAPVITSDGGMATAHRWVDENGSIAARVIAQEPDGQAVTYSIIGGADASLFTIDAQYGIVSFITKPNFEAPVDSNGNNSYEIIVQASDGSLSDTQLLTIDIADVDENVAFTSSNNILRSEAYTAAYMVTAVQPADPSATITYRIVGGSDAALFVINAATGALNFKSQPDYEAPADVGGDNVYHVGIEATDGFTTATDWLVFHILDSNESPVITSGGGGTSFGLSIPENQSAVTTISASDPENRPLTYAIAGGADPARFNINAQTGVLSFVAAPDFEAPADSDRNNIYTVIVSASDGTRTDSQTLFVTVTNQNESPAITSNGGGSAAAIAVVENGLEVTTVKATDPEKAAIAYSISGGADASRFLINSATGILTFRTAPDFEQPDDSDGNHVYEVIVRAGDGTSWDSQALSITVDNANEGVTITSGTEVSVAENGLAVMIVTAADVDNDTVSFAISGGADASLFAIDSATGALSFADAPNFEAPADSDGDNVYQVEVSATDGSLSGSRSIAVTVTDAEEAIAFVSGGGGDQAAVAVDENTGGVIVLEAFDPEGTAPYYGIAGGADAALFRIDSVTNLLQFAKFPNFEAPGDSDGDNVYEVVVGTSDGQSSDFQTIRVTISNVYEEVRFQPSVQAFSVDENQAVVATVAASGEGGASFHYSLLGGIDASRFAIDDAGVLSFLGVADYEMAGDSNGDNVYSFTISANDGISIDHLSVTVTVGNVDEPVEILSYGGASAVALTMAENIFAVAVVEARDDDGQPVTYAISGADVDSFEIDPNSGALSFRWPNAPNFEDPASWDSDNVYDVTVTASSSTSSATQDFSVTIVDGNEKPWLVNYGYMSVSEGSQIVTTLIGGDLEGAVLTYSIIGGPDAALFAVDPVTGLLSFIEASDYETPLSAAGTNAYTVYISVSDGETRSFDWLEITVNDVNEPVAITSGGGGETFAVTIDENGAQVTSVAASDGDGDALTYSITGGADGSRFAIDALTGALRFAQAPNFEAAADAGADNVYDVVVSVTDGAFTDSQAVAVTVANLNEPVSISSNGGGASAAVAVAENATAVTVVAASDPDGGVVNYAIAGGADAERFTIDSTTGALAFVEAPDFEGGADNVYEVIVAASDGSFTDTQSLTVTVGNVDEPVEIVSYGGTAIVAVNLMEDEFFTGVVVEAVDEENSPITYSIAGGADGHQFEIDPLTGALSFMQPNAADFEDPTDFDFDNVHEVIVAASTSTSSATQTFMISITNRNEAPYVYYDSSLTVNEGVQAITTLFGYDRDADSVTLAIVGGADAALFVLDPVTKLLSFIQGRDFEGPLSAAGTNVYDVEIEASDGQLTTRETLQITIRNVNEGVAITFGGGGDTAAVTASENGTTVASIAASDVDGDALTYSITGGVDGFRFTIDSGTGALRFVQAPNFEAPADVGGNNVYDVVVSVTDGAFTDSQAIAVTVGNVDEPITIASNGGGASAVITVSENGRAVTTVAAIEADGEPVRYAIVGGVDASHFTIDSATGRLAFASLPDFEARSDFDGDNWYYVVVSASDGVNTDTQGINVRVADLNEAVEIVSNGGGASASVTVAENGTSVTNVAAVDPDGRAVTYAIVGGADAARFTIDAGTGALAFVAAPNFEAPADAGADNVYDVVVSASDGTYVDTQALAVTVRNVDEQMAITSNGGGASAALAVTENSAVVTTVVGVDPDGGPVTYVILHGGDSGLFTIDSATGMLSFRAAPNFEAPGDAGGDNVYNVVVMASDGHWSDTQAIAVTVGNAEEPLLITSNGGGSSASVSRTENGTAVTVVAATDPDGRSVTYAIAGGADASRFTIDAATGALAFIAAPNFEAPGDAGGNNVYDVVVSASDGTFIDTQAIAVTVGNANEAPVVTSSGGGAGGAASVVENSLAVVTVAAADPDGTTPTYSIVGGADAARFTINPLTGALQFVAAPDWELPADSDGNNVYAVVVRASDGQLSDDQTLSVTVTNTRDGNNVTGTSAGDSISATSTNVALRTSNEEDTVFGRDGHDNIQGMAGEDDLYGEGGNDVLIGGAGSDRLTGGLGKDQFTFNSVSESSVWTRDTILDFSRAQGDKISLSAIDSNSLVSNNQAFTFIGTAAFSNVAGQLRYETWGGVTTISGDVDGDAVADLVIQLSGTITLISSDFIL
jgi:hypothetical protein